ncbi:nucleotide exchange factor GrpE [Prevotella sp. TCVGH]|uniref:nucleotide exchange factor GrpE n=1 Tax=Prevotellaceae TaxID=171552 RepID=UPI00189C0635|nr:MULTISPECIES: nucleotide exchange factor GrpE [Prevotellaceae]MCL6748334.1 nucleotide exchange factor GrpE [Prevotella sp. TCVGH]
MSKRNKHKEQETEKKLDTQHEEMDAGTVMDEKKVEEQAAATDNQPETQGEAPTTDPLAEAQAQIEELKDRYLRTVAEFENFKRRTQKEKAELIFNGSEKTVSAILPILDDMERAAANANKTDDIHALEEGWELIFKKLLKTLEGLGVKKIETQDKAFDVDFHEAVAMVPNVEDNKKGKVIDCVQTGYTLNEKVIRHAKVAVGQ